MGAYCATRAAATRWTKMLAEDTRVEPDNRLPRCRRRCRLSGRVCPGIDTPPTRRDPHHHDIDSGHRSDEDNLDHSDFFVLAADPVRAGSSQASASLVAASPAFLAECVLGRQAT